MQHVAQMPAVAAGVKSGTSILEDVLLLQLNQLATQLHTLAVSDQDAACMLVRLAGKLNEQHFQQLQVSQWLCQHTNACEAHTALGR
jgi:hypothetical protein